MALCGTRGASGSAKNHERFSTMTNENNTNAPRPLSDAEKAARAAIAAANKPADTKPVDVKPVEVTHKPPGTPQVAAIPGTAPLGLKTVEAALADAKVTITAPPAKPTSDAPDAVSKAIATLVKAAETVPANALLEGHKPAVLPDLTKPSTTGDAAHKAAIAKANANTGKPPQGGKSGGKKGGNAPVALVTSAKVKKLTKAETALANPAFVEGYNVAKWPVTNSPVDGKPVPAPTRVDIIAAKALDQTGSGPTANRLALAFYLSAYANKLNLYESSMLGGKYVCGLSGDHKMNVASKAEGDQLVTIDKSNHLPWSNGAGGGRLKVCYVCKPTAKGLKLIMTAVEAAGLKVPARWLPAPTKAADKGKAAPASGTPATA